MMDYAYEKGVNFFDTAEIYPVYPKRNTAAKPRKLLEIGYKQKKIEKK